MQDLGNNYDEIDWSGDKISKPAGKERLIARWEKLKNQPDINLLKCKVCEHSSSIKKYKKLTVRDRFEAGRLVRYQCPNCEVIFGDLRFLGLPSEEIDKDYEDVHVIFSETDTSEGRVIMFNKFELDKSLEYLDYACGAFPDTLNKLNNQGWTTYGYDKHVTVPHSRFLSNIDNRTFDVVYTNNYIEHLIDPIKDFDDILKHVKPGGKLIMASPCWEFRYCYDISHHHTFFFSEKSLKVLEKKLNIKQISSIDFKIPPYRDIFHAKMFLKKD